MFVAIPPVWMGAAPRQGAMGFGVSAVLHVLLGIWLGTAVKRGAGIPSKAQLWFLGIFAWLLGLVLMDAGFAYAGQSGLGIRTVTIAAFACVTADFAAGLLAVARTFVRDPFEHLDIGAPGQ